jgi:hypothetical protein
MKGDFSRLPDERNENFAGVLHQQGRVLLDADWNAQTAITTGWQDDAGHDIIGAGVAAVPADQPNGFKIDSATQVAGNANVKLTVRPGRVWADGLLTRLYGEPDPLSTAAVTRDATYLTPPIQDPSFDTATIATDVRDAVVLEVWREELNAFQEPDLLIEPALGGPDTTERVNTAFAFRLMRLGDGDTCETISDRLKDDFSKKGKLKVSLRPTVTGGTLECPTPAGGGYTGFEHSFYRIEIAAVDAGPPQFKWSQYGGGLVGRGHFDAPNKVTIKANLQAITNSGLSSFYLEALERESALGHWHVTYGAPATLSGDVLTLGTKVLGTIPGNPTSTDTTFFRLWNGIEQVQDFANSELPDKLGIMLAFDAPAASNYVPGDYWTFPVRTGEVVNPEVLIDTEPPKGIHYHRVPLAVLSWTATPPITITAAADQIEDCRRVFDPLTDLRGCCFEVKPGDDIHRALKKIFDAGGGCLCLLPGDHVLKKPIDLTDRTGIHIHGFGPVSRVLVSSQMDAPAPFILTNARDITFGEFSVVNQSALPLWRCVNAVRLRIEGVFALSNLERGNQPILALEGACHGWRLADNVFVGAAGLTGRLLASSAIVDNVWIGVYRGIDLVYAQDLQIERNGLLGIHADLIKDIETLFGPMATGATPFPSGLALAQGVLTAPNAAVAPSYIGVEVNGAFDVDIIDNEVYGAVGFRLEWTESCLVQRNRFRTLVTATACGVAHGLRFTENHIGVAADDRGMDKPLTCETGLVFLADVVECRIVSNIFANVKQGVVFESDFGNEKAITRDFGANLYTLSSVNAGAAQKQLDQAEARGKEAFDRSLLLSSSFFRVGTSQRVVIEENQFHAGETAIEWSGTTQVFDFRIAGNAFIGCQDVAIQIEPDARILLLADPVDTKVRLIENNRFEIYSGAVRATIGAVRVEKNDIRIDAPALKVLPPKEILAIAATNIYNSASMAQAAQSDDTPLVMMMTMEATSTVDKNPDAINATGFAKAAGDNILKTYRPSQGDALADKVFVMKTLADIGANKYLATLGNALLPKWTFNSAGFVINLAGIQNRVVHNRLYGNNPQRPGGVLYNAVSGEVRDNEIVVPGTALLLTGKFGLASGYQGAEVVGNSLASVGVTGSKTAAYALAIPSLSPGNLAINDNLFKGSVMIGGDPLSAQGYSKPDIFVFPGVFTFYNAMKLDMGTYASATLIKAYPFKFGNLGVVPPGIVLQIWETDPHANRPIVHFCQNRVIQGWVGVFQGLSGAYWSAALLKSQASQALIANFAHNVLDYGGSAVGYELVVVGNYSQAALKYRVGGRVEAVANIPAAVSF